MIIPTHCYAMGSHNSHEVKGSGEASGNGSGISTPRGSQRGSRSGSGGDLQGLPEKQEKPPPSMVPVEKLGKVSNIMVACACLYLSIFALSTFAIRSLFYRQ